MRKPTPRIILPNKKKVLVMKQKNAIGIYILSMRFMTSRRRNSWNIGKRSEKQITRYLISIIRNSAKQSFLFIPDIPVQSIFKGK